VCRVGKATHIQHERAIGSLVLYDIRMRRIFLLLSIILILIPHYGQGQETPDVQARRAELQKQLSDVESQISQTQAALTTLKGQGDSITRDIAILDVGIKKSQLQIKATQIEIQALSQNITIHAKSISNLGSKLNSERKSLAQILRKTQQIDDYSLVEVALSTSGVSNFFGDLDSFSTINKQLGESSALLTETKNKTQDAKDALEEQKNKQERLKAIQAVEEQKIVDQQAQKKKLLATTKSARAVYQSIFAIQQKTASQIRAELFGLAGGSGAISLGVAIDNAKIASKITGVRPAFILGILSQESDLGKNVGQCLVTDLSTGDGKGKNTGTIFTGVMKAPRDTVVFEKLMVALGRDWSKTAVSCPQTGGYGGAMGPTQFIPSTWVKYQARIQNALGISAADPWNALHAIVATGLYLSDGGAKVGDSNSEHTAAAKYYAGGGWAGPSGQNYADSVMAKTAKFQSDIDVLQK
jgi:membrane-bound lytic murein transglycosylase B